MSKSLAANCGFITIFLIFITVFLRINSTAAGRQQDGAEPVTTTKPPVSSSSSSSSPASSSSASRRDQLEARKAPRPPQPSHSASYVSLDGLTLVVVFDKPVNLSASIESAERRLAAASAPAYESAESRRKPLRGASPKLAPVANFGPANVVDLHKAASRPNKRKSRRSSQCLMSADDEADQTQQVAPHLIAGVQLCAQLLTKKTLRTLRKFRLHNCLWASQVQFLIKLGRPIGATATGGASSSPAARIAFQRGTIGDSLAPGPANERELAIELNRLPLEGLGVPLAPRLALTGPNQVPACGQFALTGHLSSPFGTQPDESVRLSWSVERLGLAVTSTGNGSLAPTGPSPPPPPLLPAVGGLQPMADSSQRPAAELAEARWRQLQLLVASQRTNSLLLDAQLLQFAPQLYQFRLTVTFQTSLTSVSLNASHQLSRLDFEAPIGAVYGSHLLAPEVQVNPNQELALLADIQVPECAQNVKQVGLYWQVSDPRVRFEQSYAPIYLAKPNSLPEQALVEFRLNLFYGIRVKKFASAGTLVATGDSLLEAQISDGLLMTSLTKPADEGNDEDSARTDQSTNQLELYGDSNRQQQLQDKYSYQWSCFDAKTAQPCQKGLKVQASGNGTRYDLAGGSQSPSLRLIDRSRQRQPVLRLPLAWLDAGSQMWFGLQRFDRHNPSQNSRTEYALVSVVGQQQQVAAGFGLSIGPVLVGRSRQRATVRNPLTGAILLVANAPVVIVGRLGPSKQVASFVWRLPNHIHPLHWTVRNSSSPLSSQDELLTELHLDPDLLLAHAHYQVQLVACLGESGARSVASLSLDIVQGVSQCQVELIGWGSLQAAALGHQPPAAGPIVVAISYCNIPLGLAPLTYQLHLVDTNASDGLVEGSRRGGSSEQQQDDYINEADEAFFEGLAQPVSVPQLSPVFVLGALNAASLAALLGSAGSRPADSRPPVRVRFAARVCDRLQVCKMFYSKAIDPMADLAAGGAADSTLATNQSLALRQEAPNPNSSNGGPELKSQSSQQRQVRSQALQVLRTMLDRARRANTAGNSIAAVAILSGLIGLGRRHLSSIGQQENQGEAPQGREEEEEEEEEEKEKLRNLLQVAALDCLHYGAQSMQRHFHYTESGQANLVLGALAGIMTLPGAGVELKFRSMRLIAQLARKTLDQAIILKLNCLADFKSIQTTFEALFGSFSQHSQLTEPVVATSGRDRGHLLVRRSLGSAARSRLAALDEEGEGREALPGGSDLRLGSGSAPGSEARDQDRNKDQTQQQQQRQHRGVDPQTTTTWANLLASATTTTTTTTTSTSGARASRRKREEAILTYLRSVRQSHSALMALAAAQMALGAVQRFEFLSPAGSWQPDLQGDRQTARQPSQGADIVSSLTHQTELLSDTIELDLREFGAVAIKFLVGDDHSKVLAQIGRQMSSSQLRCRNDTQSKCSSFVLALTTFAGKAPFRSLDPATTALEGRNEPALRVPVLQMDWLSPVDGSNLVDLLRLDEQVAPRAGGQQSRLRLSDLRAEVVFAIPQAVGSSPPPAEDQQQQQVSPSQRRYKCYQFSEEANEWLPVGQPDERLVDDLGQSAAGERRIRCQFAGFGVVGAFQNEPPAGKTSAELSIALGLGALLGLVAIVSLLGCIATGSRNRRRRRRDSLAGSASDRTVSSSDFDPEMDESEGSQQGPRPAPMTTMTATRHLEPTDNNKPSDYGYPLRG